MTISHGQKLSFSILYGYNLRESHRGFISDTGNKGERVFWSSMVKHWGITQTTAKGREYLKEQPSILFRRPKNLKDILVRSKFKHPEQSQPKGCAPCKKNRCINCKHVKDTKSFRSITTNCNFKIFHDVNCKSDWVIYLMECKNCNLQYVGKSKTPFNIRLNNHRSHVKKKHLSCMVTKHYTNGSTCNFNQHADFTIIERMRFADDKNTTMEEEKKLSTLQRRETFWQSKLQTFLPNGLNKREG